MSGKRASHTGPPVSQHSGCASSSPGVWPGRLSDESSGISVTLFWPFPGPFFVSDQSVFLPSGVCDLGRHQNSSKVPYWPLAPADRMGAGLSAMSLIHPQCANNHDNRGKHYVDQTSLRRSTHRFRSHHVLRQPLKAEVAGPRAGRFACGVTHHVDSRSGLRRWRWLSPVEL